MENTISGLRDDDQHLLNLIANQTTVLETFLQQARLSEDRSKQQYEWMQSNLNILENAIQHNIVENEINMRLQFISSHIISRTQHLFSTQSAMIQSVTNAHHGNLRSILHPGVLKDQLKLMKTYLNPGSAIPVTSNNLIKLYSLLSVKTRVSDKTIIFQFTLPLVSTMQYELFKPIPLPMRFKDKIILVKPTSEYFAISLHREKFMELTAFELAECNHLDEVNYICHEYRPLFKIIPEAKSCELKFFMHEKVDIHSCTTLLLKTDQLWVQLPYPNQWVFYTRQTEGFNVICGKNVRSLRLEGEGILTIQPSCALEHNSFSIPQSSNITTEFKSEFYYPEFNLSLSTEGLTQYQSNMSALILKKTDNLVDIQHSLSVIKQQQFLKTNHLTVTGLSITSFIIAVVLLAVLCVYVVYRHRKRRTLTSTEQNSDLGDHLQQLSDEQLQKPTPAKRSQSASSPQLGSTSFMVESESEGQQHPLDQLQFS